METTAFSELQTIQQQFQVVQIYLSRPAVLQQLGAIIVVAILSLFTAHFLDNLVDYIASRNPTGAKSFIADRILPAIGMTFFPIIGLLSINFVLARFTAQGDLTGLIQRSIQLFWILLIYSIVLFFMYLTIGERIMRPYQRRILTPVVTLFVVILVATDFINLELLRGVRFVERTGITITGGSILDAIIAGYFWAAITALIPTTLKKRIFPNAGVSDGVTHSVTTLIRYGLGIIGAIITLAVLGISLTTLSFVAGGLSVGIGLGLQSIVSNFFSGIVMLFEQSVRPDDWVEVDGALGIVQQVGIRSTTVRTLDNVDRIVPNENLITGTVANYTTSSNYVVRQDIYIGVSYDSNPKQVSDIILKIAKQHEFILIDPEANVFFVEYGDSSLNFRLMYFVSHPRYLLITKSDVLHDIFKAFEKHDIEIPYPQSDLNLRRGWQEVFGQNAPEAEVDEEPVVTASQ